MSADPQVPAAQTGDSSLPVVAEASLAPREGALLSLPFDQYGRMRVTQNIALALHGEITEALAPGGAAGATLSVLDVGGYPGVLRHFLPENAFALTVIDVVPDDGTIPGYMQGSGLGLPFEDASFDIVTSLDTLEHIPNDNRARFLEELKRVARHAVLLINPIQTLQNDLAEELLDEYIRWILDAQQEQLAEHRMFGLPDFMGTERAFTGDGWATTRFTMANIHNWLFMMVAKHYLISLRNEHASGFERNLDRFYNLSYSDGDRQDPAYRGVVVAVKPGLEGALRRVEELYPPVADTDTGASQRLQLAQVLMSMIDLKVANHEDKLLREQMERRDKHIAGLEGKIALMESSINQLEGTRLSLERQLEDASASYAQELGKHEIEFRKHETYIRSLEEGRKAKDEHILYLERLLQGIESGRVMRLTRSIARFLGRA